MNILIFNGGSSSLSYKIFKSAGPDHLEVVCAGKAHRVGAIGTEESFIEHFLAGESYKYTGPIPSHREAATRIFDFIREHHLAVEAIGHRFLHGGDLFHQSTWLDAEQIARLERCLPLAPIHNPDSFSVIQATLIAMPGVPQYVALDSAFHASIPEYAHTYALPQALAKKYGFRKYGFHGLSYQDVSQKAARFLGRPLDELRLVACHLGTGGSSVAAIKGGRSLDTSMGYTPLPGLIMSTRCGNIDPTLPIHLLEQGYSPAQVTDLLNKQSGLLGVSGLSSDIRDLIRAMTEQNDPRARLAFDMYVYRLKQYIGGMASTLGGFDALIFTDDVGLRCPEVRAGACTGMAWCGLSLDPRRNNQATGEEITRIGTTGAPVEVLVIPNDEERVIAREGLKLLGQTEYQPTSILPVEHGKNQYAAN